MPSQHCAKFDAYWSRRSGFFKWPNKEILFKKFVRHTKNDLSFGNCEKVRTGSGRHLPVIFAKFDLLQIEANSEKANFIRLFTL